MAAQKKNTVFAFISFSVFAVAPFFILLAPLSFAAMLPAILSGTANLSGSDAPVNTEVTAKMSGVVRGSSIISTPGQYRVVVSAQDPYDIGKTITIYIKSVNMTGYVQAAESAAYADGPVNLDITTPLDANAPGLSGSVYPSSLVYDNSGDANISSAGTCVDNQTNDYGMHAAEPYRVGYANVSSGADCNSVNYPGSNFGAWNTSPSASFPGIDGAYYCISLACKDAVGNQNTYNSTGKILYDISAPGTLIEAGTPQYGSEPVYVTSATEFTLSATDLASGVASTEYEIDSGGGETYSGPFGLSGYGDGEHAIEYYSTDNAGNAEDEKSLSAYLDDTPPATADDAPSGWQQDSILVELTPSDDACGVSYTTYRIGSGAWTNSTVIEISSDGNNSVSYYSIDNVGNAETAKTIYVAIDSAAPLVDAGTNKTAGTMFMQDATANDSVSGIASYSWTQVSGPGTISFGTPALEDTSISASIGGTYTIRLNVTDNAGNNAYDEMALTWDTAAPAVEPGSPANNYAARSSAISFVFTATDSIASIMNCSLKINGAVNAANSSVANNTQTTFNVSGFSDGIWVWNVSCADSAGNAGESAQRTFTVDTIFPQVQIILPQNASYGSATRTLNYTVNDTNLDSAWYNYNGTNSTPLAGNIIFAALGNRQSTLTLYANDSAGNTNSTSVTFTIDTISPQVSITAPTSDGLRYNDAPVLAASCNDTNFVNMAINHTAYTAVKASTPANWTNISAIPQGENPFRITCADAAGNTGAADRSFIFDTVKPAINILSPANTTYAAASIWLNTTISETATWVMYSLDGGANATMPNSSGNWNTLAHGISEGSHSIVFYANDSAGNVNQSRQIYFTVDSAAPYVRIILPENATYNSVSRTLNFTASDATSGISATWYNYNGINTTIIGNISFSALDNRQSVLALFANDTAGNINSTSVMFTVQTVHNIRINSVSTLAAAPSGEAITVAVSISNTGGFNETPAIWLLANGVNVSSSQINISAGETKLLNFSWTPASDGIYNLTVVSGALSEESNTSDNSASAGIVISTTHDISVDSIAYNKSGVGNTVYLYDSINVSVNVTNRGNVLETASIAFDGGAQSVSVSLLPNQAKEISFLWSPASSGYKTLSAEALSVAGESDFTNNARYITNIRVWSVAETMQLYWANGANYPKTAANYTVGELFYVWGKAGATNVPADITFYGLSMKINSSGLPVKWVSTGGTSDTYRFNISGGSILTSQYWQLNATASGAHNTTITIGNPGDSLAISRSVLIT